MNDEKIGELIDRIHAELDEIAIVMKRMDDGWERARRSNDDFYIDGVALNLHGFYMGMERIFTHIAEIMDNNAPGGENWHYVLLRQMAAQIEGIRPPVISEDAMIKLDVYRKFRHIVRNVYTYHFDPVRIGELVTGVHPLFNQLRAELTAFIHFLEQ